MMQNLTDDLQNSLNSSFLIWLKKISSFQFMFSLSYNFNKVKWKVMVQSFIDFL